MSFTHQARRQLEQTLDQAGCDPVNISRFCGHAAQQNVKTTSVQLRSYLTAPVLECMVAAVDFDRERPNLLVSVIAQGVPFVSDSLIGKIGCFADLLSMYSAVCHSHSACPSQIERKKKRLCTLKRSCESMICEIKCAFVLFCTRPVNPETYILESEAKTFIETYSNGTLRELFQEQVFRSPEFLQLHATIRELEDKMHHHSSQLPDAPLNMVARELKDYFAPQMQAIFTEVHAMRMQNQRAAAPLPMESPAPRQDLAPFAAPPPVLLQPPVPPSQDHLKGSSERRSKRACICQEEFLRAEAPTTIPRPTLKDDGVDTLRDNWKLYKNKWLPLEKEHGPAWRVDRPAPSKDGSMVTTKAKYNWWSKRLPMWEVVQLHIDNFRAAHPGCSEEEAEEAALVSCTDFYEEARKRKPNKNSIFAEFGVKWKSMTGHARRRGRKASVPNAVFRADPVQPLDAEPNTQSDDSEMVEMLAGLSAEDDSLATRDAASQPTHNSRANQPTPNAAAAAGSRNGGGRHHPGYPPSRRQRPHFGIHEFGNVFQVPAMSEEELRELRQSPESARSFAEYLREHPAQAAAYRARLQRERLDQGLPATIDGNYVVPHPMGFLPAPFYPQRLPLPPSFRTQQQPPPPQQPRYQWQQYPHW